LILYQIYTIFVVDMGKIIIAGIGPGSKEDITPAVLEAVREADAIVGYKYYFQFIEPYIKSGCECIDTGMKKERERAEQAFLLAEQGKTVVVISSGDAGLYGMAPLIFEMREERRIVLAERRKLRRRDKRAACKRRLQEISSVHPVSSFVYP
jgi:precorrin-3B methylase